jgi:HK97 family phage major capsid protein
LKRQYKCLVAFPLMKWVANETYVLEEKDAEEAVSQKILEIVAIDETSLMIKRAIAEYKEFNEPQEAQKVAGIVAAVFEKLHGSHGPLAVRVVQDEADKTKGLGEFLQCVGLFGDPQASASVKMAASATLENVYKAPLDPTFRERFAASEAKTKGISLKTALAESAGVTGGYTVPTEYAMQLLQFRPEDNVLVGFTDDYPMTGRELKMPALDQTTPLGVVGQSNYFGGVVASWVAEAQTRPETEPRFREITLVANELSGYSLASRNVLYDNKVALEQRLTQLFGGAVAWYRDYAYLAGDGVGKPRGIINHPATLGVNRATANVIGYADICAMYGLLMPQSIKNAFWVMQQSVLGNFLTMADTNGQLVVQPYFPVYQAGVAGGPATVRPIMSMLGLPIKTTEKVSTLGSTGDLLLIDPKQYFTASRQELEVAASEHFRFTNNQITYRFIYRGDGEPWPNSYFTLSDNSTKISPFVQLLVHS